MRPYAILAITGLLANAGAAQAETRNYFDDAGAPIGSEMPVGQTGRFYYRGDGDFAGSSMDVAIHFFTSMLTAITLDRLSAIDAISKIDKNGMLRDAICWEM